MILPTPSREPTKVTSVVCHHVGHLIGHLVNLHVHVHHPLLLVMLLVDLQNTCKKKFNRKMLERPNMCYIFEKLGVQGCQI